MGPIDSAPTLRGRGATLRSLPLERRAKTGGLAVGTWGDYGDRARPVSRADRLGGLARRGGKGPRGTAVRVLRVALAAVMLTAGLTFAPSIAASTKVETRIPIDKVTCRLMNEAAGVDADTGCYITFTEQPLAQVVPSTAAATTCGGFWKTMTIQSVGSTTSVDVNVGLCWNGSTIWRQWGPDCKVRTSPVLFGGTDQGGWCGVYNNGGTYVEPGANFWISAFSAPSWKRWGYMRYHVNRFGQVTKLWGSCCT